MSHHSPSACGTLPGREEQMQHKATNQWLITASALAIGGLVSAGAVLAQVPAQPIPLVRVDVNKMASGYRASKIVESAVVNEHGEKIGTIDDLIVEPNEMVPYAILSVGGFLGIGDHLVVVPLKSLKFSQDKIELPGATKDELRAMPKFSYATK
jgi:sporulation protein YlmC with PRC-barrel domain